MRTVLTSVAASTLAACAVAAAAPRPVPAPPGAREATLAQRVHALERDVADAERAAWGWRGFERCIHRGHVRASTRPNAAVPVTWKTNCLEGLR